MDMDLAKHWENKLKALGMPSEIPMEYQKAAEAGVELVSTDMANPEAEALEKKLQEEDPRNVLGGFPNSINTMVSLVETLREEWLAQNILAKDIRLAIHASCINGHDCVVLSYNGEKKYHYNTKNIREYSRQKMISQLRAHNLSFIEK